MVCVIAHRWVMLARKCYSLERRLDLFSYTSSSGGGLPGRPLTRKSWDACFISAGIPHPHDFGSSTNSPVYPGSHPVHQRDLTAAPLSGGGCSGSSLGLPS